MENYKFIDTNLLSEEQLLHIVQLFLEAEYGDTQLGNQPNIMLNTKDDKLEVIKPYTQITHVLMNKDEVVGFFIAANKKEIKAANKNILSWRKKDPEFISCLNFYTNETLDNDFVLHDIAIALKYRGLGLFKVLKNSLTKLAVANNCKRIVFAVRDSSPAAKVYKYHGAQVIGEIGPININNCSEKLMKCYFAT